MSKTVKQTYHLYHHQPDPLASGEIDIQVWLTNNAFRYSMVAAIQARSSIEAYQAIRDTTRSSLVTVQQGTMLRGTFPGDVFVGEKEAWMVMGDEAILPVAFQPSPPHTSYPHESYVSCLSWSPCGTYLAVGNGAGDVLLHDLYHGEERKSATFYDRHRSSGLRALGWSPDGVHIASSAGHEGEAHIWMVAPKGGHRNAATGSILICRYDDGGRWKRQIDCLAWHPDSRRLFVGRESGWIVAWDTMTGANLFSSLRHQGNVTDLRFSPDGTYLASASLDKTVRVWMPAAPLAQDVLYQGHSDAVLAVDWSPDGMLLVSCEGHDHALHLWRSETGDLVERIPLFIFSTSPAHASILRWSPTINAGVSEPVE